MAKAQAWYLDVVMAVFIFTVGIIAYHHYSLNIGNIDEERIKDMSFQADTLSTELLKSGYPNQWDSTNVIKIGLTNNNQHLDEAKWLEFSAINYNVSKQLLGMTYDYVVFFERDDGSTALIGNVCGIGMSSVIFSNLSQTNCSVPVIPQVSDLIARERYIFAQGNIMKMNVYVFS